MVEEVNNIVKYQASLGQDCSTLLIMRYLGLKVIPFAFDHVATYSSDYMKILTPTFLNARTSDVNVYIKDYPSQLNKLYNDMKQQNENELVRRRVSFHAHIGDKYHGMYIDNVHIDGEVLTRNVRLDSFATFMVSVQKHILPIAKNVILTNISNTNAAIRDYGNESILFLRTIKHRMSGAECKHLCAFQNNILRVFPNAKFVVLTDVSENVNQQSNIVYAKFDHWK